MNNQEKEIDKEWLNLIVEAKKMGLSIQEIQSFFANEQQRSS